MNLQFNTTFDDVVKDIEKLSIFMPKLKNATDEEVEQLNETFYELLEDSAELGEEKGFSYSDVYSYYKVKLFLEMADNT